MSISIVTAENLPFLNLNAMHHGQLIAPLCIAATALTNTAKPESFEHRAHAFVGGTVITGEQNHAGITSAMVLIDEEGVITHVGSVGS